MLWVGIPISLAVLVITLSCSATPACDQELCLLPDGQELCYRSEFPLPKENQTSECSHRFAEQSQVNYMTIAHSSIAELPTGLFDPLPNIYHVQIQNNEVPMILLPRTFANLTKLKHLKITNCQLKSVPEDLLLGTHIIELSFAHNMITSLPASLLRDLSDVIFLHLDHNEIETIPEDTFKNMTKLLSLDLSYNKISNLTRTLFTHIYKLQELRLNHNRLKQITPMLFVDLYKLIILELSDNQIEEIAENGLHTRANPISNRRDGAMAIKRLALDGNRLAGEKHINLAGDFIFTLAELTTLNLSRNGIEGTLRVRRWRWFSGKYVVDLSRNNIDALVVEEQDLELNDLQLQLENNNITNVTFVQTEREGSARFPSIYIDGNPLHCDCHLLPLMYRLQNTKIARHVYVEPGNAQCASPASLLRHRVWELKSDELACSVPQPICPLNCVCVERPAANIPMELICDILPEKSLIEAVPYNKTALKLKSVPSTFNDLPQRVHTLNLTGLGITQVPPIPATVSLLDLSYNKLNHVPTELLSNVGPKMRLAGNPFACDCPRDDIVHLIQNFINVEDFNTLQCADGTPILLADPQECIEINAGQQRTLAILIGVIIIVALITSTILVVLFYRHRHEVYVYMYSRNWCLGCVSEKEVDEDKTYDAFVIFSHEDREFVLDKLAPGLENGPQPYNLCLHYRDWIIGEMITAQIARSVAQSRRTIVILSENFLRSEWAQQEFKLAHSSAMREKLPRVIVIVLDDVVEDKRISSELRAYLSTNTYIDKDDKRFWSRLLYAMPHRKQSLREKQAEHHSHPSAIEMSVL